MKKLVASIISICMLVTTMVSPMGLTKASAAGTTVSDLITTGNADLFDEEGKALQDDTYQYGVASDDYYAFMWVPESAEHLNGLMVAKSNLIEPRLLESVTVRETLAKYNVGVVYLHARGTTDKPSNANIMGGFVYIDDKALAKYNSSLSKPANAGSVLDEMLARLAAVSGYDELLYAPLIGMGHSAAMGLGHTIGTWDPGRAIAQISIKGHPDDLNVAGVYEVLGTRDVQPGVPTYLATGQFTEHGAYNNPAGKDDFIDGRMPNLISNYRKKGTDRLVSASVEWETGHYDWSEQSNQVVANYLDNIIPARLGAQATSQEKIPRDYELIDLTDSDEAYVAEVAMFGKRNVVNKEGTYKHGLAKDFTEEEQKSMVWFVNKANYEFIRDFTVNRKNVEIVNEPSEDGVEDTRIKTIPTSFDRSYNINTGNFSEWPAGNICFYIEPTQAIAYEFDITPLKSVLDSLESVTFTVPYRANNNSRTAIVYQVDNPWDADRNFTVPTTTNVVAEGLPVTAIKADITDIVKQTTEDKLYFVLGTNDAGNGTDFYGKTAYDGYTHGGLTEDETLMAHLAIGYEKVEVEKPTNVYPTVDICYDHATGNRGGWNGTSHYVHPDTSIVLGFDTSALMANADQIEKVELAMTRCNTAPASETMISKLSDNPFAGGNYNAATVTDGEDIGTVDGNTFKNFDVTEQALTGESLYLNLRYTENSGTSGNDYYSTPESGYTTSTEDDSLKPQLIVTYKVETPTVVYTMEDICYDHATGNRGGWNGSSHYVHPDTNIVVGFNTSVLMENADIIEKVELAMTRSNTAPASETIISQLSASPFAGGSYNAETVSGGVDIGTIDGNTFQNFDVTELATANDTLYLNLRYTENSGTSGNDYYAGPESGYSTASEEETQRPRLIVTYVEGAIEIPEEEKSKDKHQYLRLEDPGKGVPKELSGNVSRYNAVSPGDVGYQNGIEGDPNTFSMVVDKMSQVTCDHWGTGTDVETSDEPAYLVPAMAPIEWIGVKEEPLTDTDIANHVASKWRNYVRWKNNRVYYHMTSQDGYMNLNTYDVYDEKTGELLFARATQGFQLYGVTNQSGTPQVITFEDIPDVTVNELKQGVTVNPTTNKTADGYTVDLMVDYGPLKAELQADGSYKLVLHQLPAGATYPIECKVVASQFGSSLNKVRRADPVEKVFYIYEDTTVDTITEEGKVNTNSWKMAGVTGFQVEGSGTITLGMQNDTRFNAELCEAISQDRANSTDTYYSRHYQYPAGYNPYDYWNDYPGTWTATVEDGFVALGDFVSYEGRTNVDLTYINTIAFDGDITSITPVVQQTEVNGAKANPWGRGVNILWQKPHGDAYDAVVAYNGTEKVGETTSAAAMNLVVSGLTKGDYTLTVKTVKDGQESAGVEVAATVDGKDYLIDDFEGGDLASGMNWLNYAESQSAYSFSSYMGESLLLSESDDNHYLAMQCTYTPYTQTADVKIPGGLTPEMSKLVMDIKVDKLENTQSNGQVYFELYNSTTGTAYTLERGDEFTLEDKEWHLGYTLSLSDFKLPSDAETLSQIDVLKIGRRPVGGGNNNRRAKIYLDNVVLSEVPDYTLRSYAVEKIDADETDGKADLVVSWDQPKGGADSYKVTVKKDDTTVVAEETLDVNTITYTFGDLSMGATYSVTVEVIVGGEVMESKTKSIGFYVPDKEVTYTVTQDTSYSNANTIQANCLMIGRDRIGMVQFDIEDLGKVAGATLNLSAIRGTQVPIAAFLMPNNDWIQDDSNYVPSKYKPIADGDKTLSSYSAFDRQSIFPDLEKGSDNDVVPSEAEEQLAVLQSAANGSLSEFFYGDCSPASSALSIDVTGAVSEAQRLGNTTVTLLLVTPYKVSATLDLWGKDTVWNGTAVTEAQQPKLTVAYASDQGTGDEPVIGMLGDFNHDEKVTAMDAGLTLKAAVSGETLNSEKLAVADVNKDNAVTTNDVLLILQYASGEIKEFPEE